MKRILTITILAIVGATGWLLPLGAQTQSDPGVKRITGHATIKVYTWDDGSVTLWLADEVLYPPDDATSQAKALEYVDKAHAALSGTVVP